MEIRIFAFLRETPKFSYPVGKYNGYVGFLDPHDKVNIDEIKVHGGVTFEKQSKDRTDLRLFANINDENIIKHIKRSIGTLGGGNHFIELDADDYDNKYLVIHSGSRNLGVQVCNFWQNKAIENMTDNKKIRNELIERLKSEGREKDIHEELKKIKKPNINKELAYIEGVDLHQYMHDMMICQKYAIINRQLIADIILKNMGIEKYVDTFTTIHNYIDVKERIIRKGAISADDYEKVIIPINMRDGSLICRGKGNKNWLCSAPHGAGRIMSRAKAFDSLKVKDFEESMNGIYSTSVCYETLDEAPMAYKPIDVIKHDINDTVDIIDVIKPLWNFKAKTKEYN